MTGANAMAGATAGAAAGGPPCTNFKLCSCADTEDGELGFGRSLLADDWGKGHGWGNSWGGGWGGGGWGSSGWGSSGGGGGGGANGSYSGGDGHCSDANWCWGFCAGALPSFLKPVNVIWSLLLFHSSMTAGSLHRHDTPPAARNLVRYESVVGPFVCAVKTGNTDNIHVLSHQHAICAAGSGQRQV